MRRRPLLKVIWFMVVSTTLLPVAKGTPQTAKCRKLGLPTPDRHGQCYNYYGLKDGCCHRCTTCRPGEGTLISDTACFVTCLPCNDGSYNENTGGQICLPCSDCESVHRTAVTSCTRHRDARCSACVDGYTEDSITGICIVKKKSSPRPTVTHTDEMLLAGARDRMLQAGAGDGMIKAGANDEMIKAGASDGMIKAGAGDGILQAGARDRMLQAGAGDGMPLWGYIPCVLVVVAVAVAVVVLIVHQVYKGRLVCVTRSSIALETVIFQREPKQDLATSPDHDGSRQLLVSPLGDNVVDMETTRKDTGASAAVEHVPLITARTNSINRRETEVIQRAEPSNQPLHQDVQVNANDFYVYPPRDNDPYVYPPRDNDSDSTEETGSTGPPRQETDQEDTHSNNTVVSSDANPSMQRQPHVANENTPIGGDCCRECGLPIVPSTPREETNRDQGLMCLPARQTRQHAALHCPTCAARRHQERDDATGDGQTVGTPPIMLRTQVPEVILDESRHKEMSDMPFDARMRLCHLLDGEYGNAVRGRISFAVAMEIDEEQARYTKDTNDIILKLQTMRVCVYDVIIALRNIDRTDAVNVIVEWLQGISQQ